MTATDTVERGLGAMALQEVQSRAGQANKSAARYHFGSREGLVAAVLERRMAPVNEHRTELLAGCAGEDLTVHDVAVLLVEPLAEATLRAGASTYARFLLQAMVDPVQAAVALEHLEAESFGQVRRRFREISTLPRDLAEIRFAAAVTHAISTLATWEAHGTAAVGGPEPVVADLIRTCTAVLEAPTGNPTTHQRK